MCSGIRLERIIRQSVSIIAAFPVGIVMILIVIAFMKELKEYQSI